MIALQFLHVSLNVSNLREAEQFYCDALGFTTETHAVDATPQFAKFLSVENIRTVKMRRGNQFLELAAFDPPGVPYPADSQSNDLWFQHCALATQDIYAEFNRLQRFKVRPISRNGPERLPGGIIAYKFRDPDGHPLEFIQFPNPNLVTDGGIDHSAISVSEAEKSIAFYQTTLGLHLQAQQQNTGPAQDALDDLNEVRVDVIGLSAKTPAPHLELLAYRHPLARVNIPIQSSDIAATRQVYLVDSLDHLPASRSLSDGAQAAILYDPDGHRVLLLAR